MPAWTLQTLTVGPLQMNAYLLSASASGEAILIDPGDEPDLLLRALENSGCQLRYLVCTHGHFDHVGAAAAVQAHWDLPLLCHPADRLIIESMPDIQAVYGFLNTDIPRLSAELTHGQPLHFAGAEIQVRHVPGHSPGHVMFVWEQSTLVGDCIFAGSIGRTDLPGGSFARLEKSIQDEIYTLPDSTCLYPGHGPATTVGREKATNPFVTLRPR